MNITRTTGRRAWLAAAITAFIGVSVTLAQPAPQPAQPAQPAGQQTQPARPAQDPLNARFPTLSPDGKWLAFTWHGDIWAVASAGGVCKRLTRHEANDTAPIFGPDSNTIAFASNRAFGYDVWTITLDGGLPTRVTFDSATEIPSDWTPDGKGIIMLGTQSGGVETWVAPLDGSTPRRLTEFSSMDATMSADGKRLAYTRGNGDLFQLRYHGSANYDLFIQDLDKPDQLPKQFTQSEFNEYDPWFTADGQFLVYRSEEGGCFNLWRKKLDGSAPAERLTTFDRGPGAEQFTYCAAQNAVLILKDFRLWTGKLDEQRPLKLAQAPLQIIEDATGDKIIDRVVDKGAKQADAFRDRLVFELQGDIWQMPLAGGMAQRLAGTPNDDEWPRVSPDGRFLAFQVQTTNYDVYVYDLNTGRTVRMTDSPKDDFFASWSPDGKYLVFSSERTNDRELFVVNVQDPNDLVQVTRSPGSDDDAVFTPDGESILFDSARGGTQDIWIMKRNGDAPRRLFATGLFEQVPRCSPDGKWVVFESFVENSGAEPDMMFGSINGGEAMSLGKGHAPFFSPDGEYVIFARAMGPDEDATALMKIKTPKEIVTAQEIPMIARTQTTQREAFARTFDEVWRNLSEGFYDPQMHGQDWNRVRDRYRLLAVNCETREEFVNLVNRAIGELGASHMGFNSPTQFGAPRAETGQLGATLTLVTGASGEAMKISEILAGGPLDAAWVRDGDHVLAVNGQRLGQGVNFYKMLTGQRQVTLTISAGADFANTRQVQLNLIGAGAANQLRYQNWQKLCYDRVNSGGKNQVGYIHLTEMNQENYQKLVAYLQGPGKDKKALVLDVRFNGGGYLHNELMDIFGRRTFGVFHPRGGPRTAQPELTWNRPVVVLINEQSFSDAEVFPWSFKSLKLGAVIGTKTPGGVIGTRDIVLWDGSRLRVPRVGWYTIEGKNMEGAGVEPDISVPMTLDDLQKNRDPQLAKGLEVLLAKIAEAEKAAQPSGSGAPTSGAGTGTGTNGN